jgi:hypothetical protein
MKGICARRSCPVLDYPKWRKLTPEKAAFYQIEDDTFGDKLCNKCHMLHEEAKKKGSIYFKRCPRGRGGAIIRT